MELHITRENNSHQYQFQKADIKNPKHDDVEESKNQHCKASLNVNMNYSRMILSKVHQYLICAWLKSM
jgi:hypothetical protein